MKDRRSQVVTILFTDLVNSTELLARAGDDAAQRMFQAHHDLLAEAASRHGGEEVKWLGDGLMVAFPSASDALRCAIAMQEASCRPVNGEHLTIRVGLNAGEALETAADYFGLSVVVARRLCDQAGAAEILCTDVVAGLVMGRSDFAFNDLGPLALKGIPHPIPALSVNYEVALGPALPAQMPFVGRQPELARLHRRWAEATGGHGGLVILAGEPGIGKTRLAEELAVGARQAGAEVLWGHCFEGEWMPPYAPFTEAFEALAQAADPDELRGDVGPWGPALSRLVPALGKVVAGLPEVPPLEPLEERFRLLDSLARVLIRRASRRPVLLCLDDLHWADQATVDALEHLARQAARQRLLILGTYRDTEMERDHPLTRALRTLRREECYERIAIEGLPAADVGDLLAALAEHRVPEPVASTFATETNGNPFFLREVIRHLIEEEKIRRGPDGRWTSEVPVEDLGLPEGVRDVVERRLARLSDAANRLLVAASAFEGSFRLETVAAAAGLGDDEALDALDEALGAQIVTSAGGHELYAFTHALIRQTVYAGLNPSRRIRLHRRVAEALAAASGAAPAPATAGEIATQYHRSRMVPGAEPGGEAALVAAAHAEANGGQAEAARFLRLALDLLPPDDSRRPQVTGRLGMALIWSQAVEEGYEVARQAGGEIAAAEGPEAAAAYLAAVAPPIGAGQHHRLAWQLAAQGLGYAGDRRDLTWARLVVLDLQRREWEAAVDPGIPLDIPERWEAARILRSGNPDPAGFGALEAPFSSRQEVLARSGNFTCLACYAGEFARCVPEARAEAEASLARGQQIRAARCFMVSGICEVALGRFEDGRATLDRAASLVAPGWLYGVRHGQEMLTAYLDDEKGLIEVAAWFTELIPGLASGGQAWSLGPTYAIVARTAARLGRTEDALHYLELLVPWLERAPGWAMHFPVVAGYAAETLWLLQRVDHASLVERALRERVLAPDFRDMEVDARLALARLCSLNERYDEAADLFAEARRVLAEQGARPLLAMTDYDEAVMRIRRGRPGDAPRAENLAVSACRQFSALGMARWARRAEEISRQPLG